MKKVIALSVALFAAAFLSTNAFAAEGPLGLSGFGVYGSFGNTSGAMGGGIGLSLKWRSFPVLGLQYDFNATRLNASVDYYVIDAEGLARNLSYYLGAGIYAGVASNDNETAFDFGLRMPFGLQFWPVKKLELFLAPVLAIPLYPAPNIGFGIELGVRMRF